MVITTAAVTRPRSHLLHRLSLHRPRLHRAFLCALLAAACLALAGCSTGFRDQTNQQYQAAAGISDRSHAVYVLNALVVTDGNGNGTMVGTLLNQGKTTDTLQSVSATDAKGKTIPAKLASPVTLKPAQAVKLETGGVVRLTSSALKAGYFVNVTFSFANAAPVQVSIPVLVNGPVYSSVPVGPA